MKKNPKSKRPNGQFRHGKSVNAKSKRPHGQLRQSQLVTTYGPGSVVDLPKYSVLVAGLDDWFSKGPEIIEPRLVQKIQTLLNRENVQLFAPPPDTQKHDGKQTGIIGYQFPEWFVSQGTVTSESTKRFLVFRRLLDKGNYIDDYNKKFKVVPVRFIRACPSGHIGDIDWYKFVHRDKETDCRRKQMKLYMDEVGSSGDLSKIFISCDCGTPPRIMTDATLDLNLYPLGPCNGERPWLGPGTNEACGKPSRLLVKTASNAYFAHTLGVISLPDKDEYLGKAVDGVWDYLQIVENEKDLEHEMRRPAVREAMSDYKVPEILKSIDEKKKVGTGADKKLKQAELEVLLSSKVGLSSDVPDGKFFARVLNKSFNEPWMQFIDKVVLVHRLREVVAQIGFTRFEASTTDIDGEVSNEVQRAVLAKEANWLPAIENKGEGVFISIKSQFVSDWLAKPEVVARGKSYNEAFAAWEEKKGLKDNVFPGLPYLMLHSLSHLLITAISMECGYPTSSLRERVFAVPDIGYGVLIYTGSSDAEGTLGGLIESGRNIQSLLKNALANGELCSNDPVCCQHQPNDTFEERYLLGAACHGCLLISETSCEMFNQFLDRSLVVPTIEGFGAEFFPSTEA